MTRELAGTSENHTASDRKASVSKQSDAPAQKSAVPPSALQVAEGLRHAIQDDQISPGEWLREVRLCADFGVGRSVVRRALRMLADDGLVEIKEHRGARVSATTVEEVFDLYEVRAALYGLAARFACMRASDDEIATMVADIDKMLNEAAAGEPSEKIIELSEKIFSAMAAKASSDAREMIEAVRRKTRFHFSYVALALNANAAGPYKFWREVRAAIVRRDADTASQAAREILYFMQGEVAKIMLSHRRRTP